MRFKDEVLIPYFRQLGYQFVRGYHGPNELGKDIVMYKNNGSGKRINYAVVVKAKRISGRATGDISEISTQVNQAFGSSYLDPETKKRLKVDKVIIANNHPIPPRSFDAIHSAINHYIERVEFHDGNKIMHNIIDNKMQIGLFPVISSCFDDIMDKYKLNGISFKQVNNRKQIIIEPSLSTPNELLKGSFSLNSLGNEKMNVLYKTGEKVTIYSDEIKNITLPKIWEELNFNNPDSSQYKIVIGPSGRTNRKLILNLLDTNNNVINYEYLYVKNSGTDVISLKNDDPILSIKLDINIKEKNMSTFNIQFREYERISAYKLYKYEKLIFDICTAEEVVIIDEETGITFTTFKHNEKTDHYVYKDRIELLKKLYSIQEYFNTVILIPNRSFSDDEVDQINKLYQIIQDGYYLLSGGTVNLSLELNDNAEMFLKTGSFNEVLSLETTENIVFFETDLSLGKINFLINGGYMECTKCKKANKEYVEVIVKFDSDSKCQIVYDDIKSKKTLKYKK